jgi:hypothetical protein
MRALKNKRMKSLWEEAVTAQLIDYHGIRVEELKKKY